MNIKIHKKEHKKSGFTLIETMVAVFILSMAIVSIIGTISRSFFASIYAKNEITATYLLQEAVDYIRNDRDSSVILGGVSWDDFVNNYNNCGSDDGCYINILNKNITACQGDCPKLSFREDTTPYYYYATGEGNSNFRRKIIVKENTDNTDQLDVYVTVEWKNGGENGVVRSRSLEYSLLNWMK